MQIIHGRSQDVLPGFPDNHFDAVVTDPPYGLSATGTTAIVAALTAWLGGRRDWVPQGRGFMGQEWDAFVPPPALWDEVYRVLKPGGYAAVFAGDRTSDLMALSLRLAGFEMRMPMMWVHGQGMPKSRTSLKPAFEPILLARKPLSGTERANMAHWGTGALHVDAARIPHHSEADRRESETKNAHQTFGSAPQRNTVYGDLSMLRPRDYDGSRGRWPASVLLDEAAAEMLDEQSGVSRSRVGKARAGARGDGWGFTHGGTEHNDVGGASRFFFVAKPTRAERPRYVNADGKLVTHPTVKPLALIEHTMSLVAPPGGKVLDPFAGSGPSVEVGLRGGWDVTAIEEQADYLPLIEQRVARVS